MTGAVQHHCDIQTHSISSLLDTITHLTPGTQPRQEPRPTARSGNLPAPRHPGTPATRPPYPAAPGSTWKCPHVVSAWQHPAAPRSTRHPATRHPNTRQHPGNPATRPGNTRQPGNQGESFRTQWKARLRKIRKRKVVPASSRVLRSNAAGKKSLIGVGLANFPQSYQHFPEMQNE